MTETKFFTDEILTQNFVTLDKFASSITDALGDATTLLERHEVRLEVLEKLARRPITVKSSKLLTLTVMGVSAYAGYKYAEKKFKEEFAELRRLREHERQQAKSNHPAGSKINGNQTPRQN